jgi:hypothetical protein
MNPIDFPLRSHNSQDLDEPSFPNVSQSQLSQNISNPNHTSSGELLPPPPPEYFRDYMEYQK